MKKKIRVPSEGLYVIAIFTLSFAVAMMSAADFGISMVPATAYILSHKLPLTFGQCEYLLQGIVFAVLCIILRKVKLSYLSSFLTCLFYGAVLDLWRLIIPFLNPNVMAPGSFSMPVRILMYCAAILISSSSLTLFFNSYLYPQVYEFFVKSISLKFSIDRTKVKRFFDLGCLTTAVTTSLLLFGELVGIGIGTVVLAVMNSILIGMEDRFLNRHFEIYPLFPKLEEKLSIL